MKLRYLFLAWVIVALVYWPAAAFLMFGGIVLLVVLIVRGDKLNL